MNAPILQVRDLTVSYAAGALRARAVDRIGFDLEPGERLGIVGESGSGKTTLALSILRLHKPPARIDSGRVIFCGQDILQLDGEALRRVRWKEMSFIPQGAMNSLNPVMRIRHQIADAIRAHVPGWSRAQTGRRIEELLERVGLMRQVAELYPHELSGGMKQRVCIALAIVLEPKLIIADEPTSALDVVVQRMVMQTLKEVQKQIGAAMIVISHDMGLMAQSVDRLAVVYAGRMVDIAPVSDFFRQPLHPYSQALIASLPSPKKRKPLTGIPGMQPPLFDLPSGCPFHPRCPVAEPRCSVTAPVLAMVDPQRRVACHLVKEMVDDECKPT
jgi:peptide/nickel transport system ATP-binding protein